MKSTKQNILLFLGMSLMLTFAYIGSVLMRDIRDTIIIHHVGAEIIPSLRWQTVLFSILAGFLFIWISWKGRIDRAFNVFFPVNALFYGGFAWMLLGHIEWLDQAIISEIFYLWSSVAMLLSVSFIWGYANQVYTFKSAALQYPLFFLVLIFAVVFSSVYFGNVMTADHAQSVVCMTIAFSSLLTIIVYIVMKHGHWEPFEEGFKVSWVYWLALAAIVFGVTFAKPFDNFTLTMQLKALFVNPADYSVVLGRIAALKGVFEQIVGLLGIVLGVFLYFRPRWLAKLGGIMVLVMSLCGLAVFQSHISTAVIGFTLFGSLSSLLLKLIKELAYFGIEREKRFTAKLVVDVIVVSFPAVLGSALSSQSMYVNLAFFLGAMAVCFIGLIGLTGRIGQTGLK